jgi:hypothetical protein
MNRRNFINNLLIAGASFMVLPGAGRIWKATLDPRSIPNPNYFTPADAFGTWHLIEMGDDGKLHLTPIRNDLEYQQAVWPNL